MIDSIPIGAYLLIGILAVVSASLLGVVVSIWAVLVRAEGARDRALHEKNMHEREASRLRREIRWRDRGVWVPSMDHEPEIDGRTAHH